MTGWKLLSIVLIGAATLGGAERLPPEVEGLVDRARGVPPEFAADALLRIAESKLVPTRELKVELIEEAFRLAAQAQMPTPLMARGHHTDTVPGWREAGSETGLNSLTLQVRAIIPLQVLDPPRMPLLFEQMRPLDVKPGSCLDTMRPVLDSYYKAMLAAANHGFNAEQKKRGEPERWVTERITAITSPLQLRGVMQAVSAERGPLRTLVLQAVASAMPNIHGDWFSFAYADRALEFSDAQGEISILAAPARDYIVRHLRGPRCAPSHPSRAGEVPPAVEMFNQYVKRRPNLQLDPIDASKLEPSRIDERYKLEEFWQSEKSKQVLEALRWLNHGNRNLPGDQRFWTLAERQTPEWNERYLALLKLIEGWKPDDEASPAAYFHMRAHTYMSLTNLVPPGTQRTNAFRTLISILNSDFNGPVGHAEWFTHARSVVGRTKSEPMVLDDMEQYGNAVLSLYAHLVKRGLGTF